MITVIPVLGIALGIEARRLNTRVWIDLPRWMRVVLSIIIAFGLGGLGVSELFLLSELRGDADWQYTGSLVEISTTYSVCVLMVAPGTDFAVRASLPFLAYGSLFRERASIFRLRRRWRFLQRSAQLSVTNLRNNLEDAIKDLESGEQNLASALSSDQSVAHLDAFGQICDVQEEIVLLYRYELKREEVRLSDIIASAAEVELLKKQLNENRQESLARMEKLMRKQDG